MNANTHHLNLDSLEIEPDLPPPATPAARPRRTEKPVDATARRDRGIALLGSRRIAEWDAARGEYLVQGSKPGQAYLVEVTPAGVRCSCPDYTYRCAKANTDCKHGVAVRAHIALAAAPVAA